MEFLLTLKAALPQKILEATKIPLEHGFTGLPLKGKSDNVEEKHIFLPRSSHIVE